MGRRQIRGKGVTAAGSPFTFVTGSLCIGCTGPKVSNELPSLKLLNYMKEARH